MAERKRLIDAYCRFKHWEPTAEYKAQLIAGTTEWEIEIQAMLTFAKEVFND